LACTKLNSHGLCRLQEFLIFWKANAGFDNFSFVFHFTGTNGSPQLQDVANLIKALRWPGDLNFPCIDLVRLSLVNPAAVELLLAKHSEELLDLLLQNLSPSSKAANQMLALRSLANLFGSEKGVYYFD
jgi:hypothetical protein